MIPKFTNIVAWEQAELLMQPALLRLVDNLRKEIENSVWQATYQEVLEPIPGHCLILEWQGEKRSFHLWELCYQICFSNYRITHAEAESVEVQIDTNLLDMTGDIDWEKLDQKAQNIVSKLFAELPKLSDNFDNSANPNNS